MVNGYIYDFNEMATRLTERGNITLTADWRGIDITGLFQPDPDACRAFPTSGAGGCSVPNKFPGSPPLAPAANQSCPTYGWLDGVKPKGRLFFYWSEIEQNVKPPHMLMAFNGAVLNVTSYLTGDNTTKFLNDSIADARLAANVGRDATRAFLSSGDGIRAIHCLQQRYLVGYVDQQSGGCGANQTITTIVLTVILGVVLARFLMAITFHWVISARMTTVSAYTPRHRLPPPPPSGTWRGPTMGYTGPSDSFSRMPPAGRSSLQSPPHNNRYDMHAILLVTCYSEGEAGIRNTLDSLAGTEYPDDHKLLFVICDGIIKGQGENRATPDVVVDMMVLDEEIGTSLPKEYLAIADGAKQLNRAKVYTGHYVYAYHTVPMITVVKCGAESELSHPKPGNRGKRDSQLVLMNFLSRVMFNDRMSPLDHTLFHAIHHITKGTLPDAYEVVLMVDADTVVAPDSLTHMIRAMQSDDKIMGLCGETRIANKRASWVSMIQVFEYYISHHLGKAFESVFGGVTCLPGCFCMYRIKARKGVGGHWIVPILVNPDIVEEYSENVVDTLHKKNLLLLGEDRFLTTLMLRSFPKRKMVFVPKALCRTVVPDEFKVLLSQRRRWINSTIHNLLELVKLRDLCGIFCFSMQFVIALELIGTVVLPAAIVFVFVLIFSAFVTGTAQTIPLLMLAATLGLPGVLIIITTRKLVYVGWMFIYLLALPIWNFVLPAYAFWNFDDFSWGETRKVAGDAGGHDHSTREGEFDPASVPLKKWAEWEAQHRRGPGSRAPGAGRPLPEPPVGNISHMAENVLPPSATAVSAVALPARPMDGYATTRTAPTPAATSQPRPGYATLPANYAPPAVYGGHQQSHSYAYQADPYAQTQSGISVYYDPDQGHYTYYDQHTTAYDTIQPHYQQQYAYDTTHHQHDPAHSQWPDAIMSPFLLPQAAELTQQQHQHLLDQRLQRQQEQDMYQTHSYYAQQAQQHAQYQSQQQLHHGGYANAAQSSSGPHGGYHRPLPTQAQGTSAHQMDHVPGISVVPPTPVNEVDDPVRQSMGERQPLVQREHEQKRQQQQQQQRTGYGVRAPSTLPPIQRGQPSQDNQPQQSGSGDSDTVVTAGIASTVRKFWEVFAGPVPQESPPLPPQSTKPRRGAATVATARKRGESKESWSRRTGQSVVAAIANATGGVGSKAPSIDFDPGRTSAVDLLPKWGPPVDADSDGEEDEDDEEIVRDGNRSRGTTGGMVGSAVESHASAAPSALATAVA
ncbi:hypothetical protein HK104_006577 [Borealophlyctis nickersoniae]|nr:hypothetical protein HK104_006577 [Borealophlyctis nickersoniae]